MSYGRSLQEAYRMVGAYSGRIPKGDKPGDLRVEQVTKIELIRQGRWSFTTSPSQVGSETGAPV